MPENLEDCFAQPVTPLATPLTYLERSANLEIEPSHLHLDQTLSVRS